MKQQRKTVYIFFGGGVFMPDDNGRVNELRTEAALTKWMQRIPELGILARLKPVFLYAGAPLDEQPAWWKTIAELIAKHYRDADGFVVTQPLDAIPYTAAALGLMLQNIGKPVVITGSPDLPVPKRTKKKQSVAANWLDDVGAGIRANLINAVQVATMDIGEAAVLFGNRLIRAGNTVRQTDPSLNVFESAGIPPLGRVDFGLTLENHRRLRRPTTPKLSTKIGSRVLQLAIGPTTAAPVLPVLTRGELDGIFLSGQPLSAPSDVINAVLAYAKTMHLPVAVFAHWPIPYSGRFLVASRMTQPMALVKYMWALGQTSQPTVLQKLLDTDVTGEMIRLEKERI